MYNFEEFKKEVVERFIEYMPETYSGFELRIQEANKVNGTLTGLMLVGNSKQAGKMSCTPTFYLEHMYDSYLKSKDFDSVLIDYARQYADRYEECSRIAIKEILDLDDVGAIRKNIVFQVISKESNKQLLKEVPHKDYLNDIAIIYRVICYLEEDNTDGISSFIVNHAFLEYCGIDENELYDLAYENTKERMPLYVSTIKEKLCKEFGFPVELFEEFDAPELYFVTNKQECWGASYMLYPEVFKQLADEVFHSDIYILPSSIHECICLGVCDSNDDIEALSSMVMDVNGTEVLPEERLSNQVYYYSRKTGMVSVLTSNISCVV